jgi:DNA-binding winged helix-turn-helix (wHTH) protein
MGASVQFIFDDHTLDTERRELRRGDAMIAMQPQVFDVLGSRLIKSTIQEQRRDILRRGSFAPAGHIGLQCA